MKIERISDNQIRCTLNKEDLEGKETLLSELAFGSEKAKGLFRELMNKAATELGFETSEDNPLMVEAIPVSKECLILVITRVDNPEDFREHYKELPKSLLAGQLAGADEDILSNLPDLLSDFGKSAFSADSGNDMKRVLAKECDELDALYKEETSKLTKKELVVAHEAFGYLCHAYGLEQMGIEGLSADDEPDPKQMSEVIRFAKEHQVKTIFFED